MKPQRFARRGTTGAGHGRGQRRRALGAPWSETIGAPRKGTAASRFGPNHGLAFSSQVSYNRPKNLMVDDDDSSIIRKKDVTTGPPKVVVIGVPVLGSVVAILLGLLVVWLWATARAFIVPQSAMAPAIFGGDEIRADATAFGLRLPLVGNVRAASEPARGDVIVFDWPSDRTYTYVMRVVAVAGDDVQVLPDGSVDLQGKPLRRCSMGTWPKGRDPNGIADGRKAFVEWSGDRAYVILLGDEKPTGTTCVDSPCKVPPGNVFVLGDNRSASQDSRHWGFVPVDHVIGRVKDLRTPGDLSGWNACLTSTP